MATISCSLAAAPLASATRCVTTTSCSVGGCIAAAPLPRGGRGRCRGVSGGIRAFSQSEMFTDNGLSAAVSAAAASSRPQRGPAPVSPVCKVSQGDTLPAATLKDQDGKTVKLTDFKGKPLVLYFYPGDNTPGCTKQACAFRDSFEKFKKAGAEVVGVSADGAASHKAFKQKYRLPFTLLTDEDNKVRKGWGIPGDFFNTLPGRQTYVCDKSGKVQLIFNNQFSPEKHVDETLKILKSM